MNPRYERSMQEEFSLDILFHISAITPPGDDSALRTELIRFDTSHKCEHLPREKKFAGHMNMVEIWRIAFP